MMQVIFEALSKAVQGAPAAALAAAFAWGILSVILSPCHLTSIPLIVAFVNGQGRISTRRAFFISSLFAGGILVTIAAIGVITALAGRVAGDIGPYGSYVVAAIFLLVGLHLLDVLPAPWAAPANVALRHKGGAAAFILGLVFGIALGPCTFAYMAPVLAVAFGKASEAFAYAAALLAVYGVGHCSVIVAAGTATEAVQRYLDWNERSKGAIIVKRACGVLLIVAALYMVWMAT